MTPPSIRFSGVGKPPRVVPFGLTWTADGEALAIQLEDDEALDAIPEASTLPPKTLVIVLPEPARGRGILSAFGRRPIARSVRCQALLLRGYVDIAATIDPKTRLDLVTAISCS